MKTEKRLPVGVVIGVPPEKAAQASTHIHDTLAAVDLDVAQVGIQAIASLSPARRQAAVAGLRARAYEISATVAHFDGEDYTDCATIARTGGLIPDTLFEDRLRVVAGLSRLTADINVKLMSMHAGFLPNPRRAAEHKTMLDRLRRAARSAEECGVTLCLETGQETAETLRLFLQALDRPNVGVNFDPANMVLYGNGDPLEAVGSLSPWIKHVHVKDARTIPAKHANAWHGVEVPLGRGDARIPDVLRALIAANYRGPLVIEREGGDWVADVKSGKVYLEATLGSLDVVASSGRTQ